jgi:hypothetical protein
MGWAGEAEFKHILRQVAHGATRERLELLATLAVEEELLAYKVVTAVLVKKLKEVKPQYRLRVFYAISAVARQSVGRRALASRYVERLSPQLDAIAAAMEQAPAAERRMVARVLEQWWREGVFSPSEVAKLQARFKPDADAPAAGAAASAAADGGKATCAAAPAPAAGHASSPCVPAPPLPLHRTLEEYDPSEAAAEAAAEAGWAKGAGGAGGGAPLLPRVPIASLPPPPPPLPQAPDGRPRPNSAAGSSAVE